jgi:hypothetical protein
MACGFSCGRAGQNSDCYTEGIVFILAIAMPVVGLYVLAQLFIWGHGIFGRSVTMGSFLIGIGIYVLWADFIEPTLGMWRKQK